MVVAIIDQMCKVVPQKISRREGWLSSANRKPKQITESLCKYRADHVHSKGRNIARRRAPCCGIKTFHLPQLRTVVNRNKDLQSELEWPVVVHDIIVNERGCFGLCLVGWGLRRL